MKATQINKEWPDPPVLEIVALQCKRCFTYHQNGSCRCGYLYSREVKMSRKEYCERFGHIAHSPILKTVEEGRAIKEIHKCLCCGEEFKRDPPIESIGCGNCKKENRRPEDWHDECLGC